MIYDDWRLRQLLCEFIQSFILTAVYRRFSRSILKTPLCVVSNFVLLRNRRKILTTVTQRSNLFCLTFNKTLRKLCPIDYSASKLKKSINKVGERRNIPPGGSVPCVVAMQFNWNFVSFPPTRKQHCAAFLHYSNAAADIYLMTFITILWCLT